MNQDPVTACWHAYLATLPADAPARQAPYVAEAFGDNAALADELAALVLAGTKTATCSALWEWEAEGQALPGVGLHTVVLDGRGVPVCIIETTGVTVRPYDEVDARFAWEEGEGDRSLDYWRTAHWHYFARTLPSIGRSPTPKMPLVCEWFRLVWK